MRTSSQNVQTQVRRRCGYAAGTILLVVSGKCSPGHAMETIPSMGVGFWNLAFSCWMFSKKSRFFNYEWVDILPVLPPPPGKIFSVTHEKIHCFPLEKHPPDAHDPNGHREPVHFRRRYLSYPGHGFYLSPQLRSLQLSPWKLRFNAPIQHCPSLYVPLCSQ